MALIGYYSNRVERSKKRRRGKRQEGRVWLLLNGGGSFNLKDAVDKNVHRGKGRRMRIYTEVTVHRS